MRKGDEIGSRNLKAETALRTIGQYASYIAADCAPSVNRLRTESKSATVLGRVVFVLPSIAGRESRCLNRGCISDPLLSAFSMAAGVSLWVSVGGSAAS